MNIPNKLTTLRFLLTMVFLVLASVPEALDDGHLLYWRIGFVISIIAGVTDFFDGYLARKYQLITNFGKLMDPLTDKIFTVSCFVVLVGYGIVPAWICALILTREFAVTGLRTMAANKGEVMGATSLGKVKTVAQMVVLAVGGLIWTGLPTPDIRNCYGFPWAWDMILWSIAALTVYTGVDYFYRSRHLYMKDL